MKRKTLQRVIQMTNPDALKQSGVIVLNLDDEDEAHGIARMLAAATGREITVFDEELTPIETIPAASLH